MFKEVLKKNHKRNKCPSFFCSMKFRSEDQTSDFEHRRYCVSVPVH